jgi:hypothetical protein
MEKEVILMKEETLEETKKKDNFPHQSPDQVGMMKNKNYANKNMSLNNNFSYKYVINEEGINSHQKKNTSRKTYLNTYTNISFNEGKDKNSLYNKSKSYSNNNIIQSKLQSQSQNSTEPDKIMSIKSNQNSSPQNQKDSEVSYKGKLNQINEIIKKSGENRKKQETKSFNMNQNSKNHNKNEESNKQYKNLLKSLISKNDYILENSINSISNIVIENTNTNNNESKQTKESLDFHNASLPKNKNLNCNSIFLIDSSNKNSNLIGMLKSKKNMSHNLDNTLKKKGIIYCNYNKNNTFALKSVTKPNTYNSINFDKVKI